MSTSIAQKAHDKQSRLNETGGRYCPPDLAANRAVQNEVMNERHAGFDLSAKDNHMKYERSHFAVVGEGTKSSQDAYRKGWETTFGKKEAKDGISVQSK